MTIEGRKRKGREERGRGKRREKPEEIGRGTRNEGEERERIGRGGKWL